MTSATPSPPSPPAPRSAWIDRLTGGLLAASVGVVLAAATPAVLRAAGVEIPIAAPPSSGVPLALPHPPPEIRNPGVETDGDEDDALGEPHGQLGQTRGRLVLHDHPAPSADVVGRVDKGELVSILRIAGDWALVYYAGTGNLVVGWAKKSEIAIR